MLKKFWLTLSAIALASTACSDSSKREWHVDAVEGQSADPTGELARLHEMEKIRVFLPEGGADGKGAYEDWDITQLRQTVVELCELRHVVSIASPATYTCGDTVARGGSDIAAETCSAETMNEIAHAAVAPIELKHVAATWHYVVPPQSEPARLAMLRDVRYFATRAAYKAQRMLQGIALESRYNPTSNAGYLPAPCPLGTWGSTYKTSNSIPKFYPDEGPRVDDRRTISQIVGAALSTGERLLRDSSFEAAEKTLGVAEWDRGSTESLVLAQQRSFSRPSVSRAAAAHLLVGGPEGLFIGTVPDSTGQIPGSDAFCTAPPLSGSARRALAAMREAAISPVDVSNGTTTDDLANGAIASGSVRQRLAISRGVAISSIYQELGVTLNDFKEARDYMRQELKAFGRSNTAQLGNIGSYLRFASTASEPEDRGPEYYSAIARQQPATSMTPAEATGNDVWLDNPPSLAQFYTNLLEAENDLGLVLADPNTSASTQEALRPVLLLLQRVKSETAGTVLAYYDASLARVTTMVWTQLPTTAIYFYAGEDDLACALTGKVEGAPCTVSPVNFNLSSTAMRGGKFFSTTLADSVARGKRIYVVRANGAERSVLGSIPSLAASGGPKVYLTAYAAMPTIEGKVRDILRPSPAFCSHAAVECNGDLFDERISLENELTSDNDSVESSWKHYLDRADAAAKEADSLGEAYLNAQIAADHQQVEEQQFELQVRDRVEQELEVVQQVCGVNTDADTILNLFGQTGALENLTDTQCTNDAACLKPGETSTTQVRQCISGRCVSSPTRLIGTQDIQTVSARLAECLGADRIVPRVVMGNKAVCVHGDQDPCGSDLYCPRVVPDGQDPATFCTALSAWNGKSWSAITEKLNFYDVQPISEFVNVKQYVNTEVFSCRQKRVTPILNLPWARRDAYGPWVSTTGTYKECDDRTTLTAAEQAKGYGYDPAVYTADKAQWVFPEGGNGTEILKCPDDVSPTDLQVLSPTDQLWVVQQVAKCRAQQLSVAMGTRILSNVPSGVIDVLREHGPQGIFPKYGGIYGEKLADFRAILVGYGENTRHIGEELDGVTTDIGNYKLQLEALGLAGDKLDLNAQELVLEREINDCRMQQIEAKEDGAILGTICKIGAIAAVAAGTVATGGAAAVVVAAGVAAGANGMGAIYGLGTEMEELDQSKRIIEVQNQLLDLKKQGIDVSKAQIKVQQAMELVATREALRRRASAILGYAVDSKSKTEVLDGKLADLEVERDKARRALSRAIAAASPQLRLSEQKLVRLTSNVAELQRRRYEGAFKNATRLAFLAKRAIEQRLGLRFAELTQKLPLMEAPPAVWENEICVASGLDYQALQQSENLPESNLQGFIGAYVEKLRNVVDAYQLQYAFHEGQDLLTVSMKEDLFRGQQACSAPSKNLIKESSSLGMADRAADSTLTMGGSGTIRRMLSSTSWVPFGCAAATTCLWPSENSLNLGDFGDLGDARPMVIYGSAAGRLQQAVALTPGSYVLSWFETGRQTGADVRLVNASNAVITPASTAVYNSHTVDTTAWVRYSKRFELATAATYKIDILPSTHAATAFGWISIGAPMLEKIDTPVSGPVASTFESTDASGAHITACADPAGEFFRNQYWSYDCERVCPQGTSSNCKEDSTLQRCYHETAFSLRQVDIESGRTLRNTGFAFGNFNYRIDQIAVNVVGNARQCEGNAGSSCFAAGYAPYSIRQRGPFLVRNHIGQDVPVALFDGRIESAKALAAERYLTNPLNTTDADLISSYQRGEFQGRPLDANYIVRIWDDEGFNFDAVKDVQLLVKYRYWTSAE
jgi:hypothetical protein